MNISGPRSSRAIKFWCQSCDHVAKRRCVLIRPGVPVMCPACQAPMRNMGEVWKPGPKGDRMRNYPEGWGKVPRVYWWDVQRFSAKRRAKGKILPLWISR